MIFVTAIRTDGTRVRVGVNPTFVAELDSDPRPDAETKTIITKSDGRKLFVLEDFETIATKLAK